MRHNVRGRKLGRTSSHRRALFRNQLASLVVHERIVTTLEKAKELRSLAERVVTHGRQDSVSARRWVRRWLGDREVLRKVFDEIGPRFRERPGGYLRIVKLGPRHGDGAEMAVLEFVDREAAPPEAPKKAKGRSEKRAPEPAAEAGPVAEAPEAAESAGGARVEAEAVAEPPAAKGPGGWKRAAKKAKKAVRRVKRAAGAKGVEEAAKEAETKKGKRRKKGNKKRRPDDG